MFPEILSILKLYVTKIDCPNEDYVLSPIYTGCYKRFSPSIAYSFSMY